MNKLEQKVAAILLRKAVDEFSNHGCNDFSLRNDAGLTEKESIDFIEILNNFNKINNPHMFEPKDQDTDVVPDWFLCSMLASKLEES